LTFKKFLIKIEEKKISIDSKSREEYIRKRKKTQELDKLKETQKAQQEEYENYFKLSNKEFDRRRRKKSREKLDDFNRSKKDNGEIVISDEITEKIEKFKSQFEKKFKRDYLIKKEEDQDPLDLIRERKNKKKKEFDEYKEHFDSV
jgi:hypothetical protein